MTDKSLKVTHLYIVIVNTFYHESEKICCGPYIVNLVQLTLFLKAICLNL